MPLPPPELTSEALRTATGAQLKAWIQEANKAHVSTVGGKKPLIVSKKVIFSQNKSGRILNNLR